MEVESQLRAKTGLREPRQAHLILESQGGEPRQAHLILILQLARTNGEPREPRQAHLILILQLATVFAMVPGPSSV